MSHEIVSWLKQYFKAYHLVHYEIVDACIYLEGKTQHRASLFKESFFQIASPKRLQFDNIEENLQEVLRKSSEGCHLILLGTAYLTSLLAYDKKDESNPTFLGMEMTHYMNVYELKHDPVKNTIQIKCETWGRVLEKSINYDDFLKGYRGAIIIKTPIELNSITKLTI